KFDLTLAMEETAEGLFGGIEYNAELFDDDRIGRLIDHFRVLLEAIVARPETRVSQLPMLTEAEQRQLLIESSGALGAPRPASLCIHERFEARAAETPGAEALVAGPARLNYATLNRRANQLAHHLRSL